VLCPASPLDSRRTPARWLPQCRHASWPPSASALGFPHRRIKPLLPCSCASRARVEASWLSPDSCAFSASAAMPWFLLTWVLHYCCCCCLADEAAAELQAESRQERVSPQIQRRDCASRSRSRARLRAPGRTLLAHATSSSSSSSNNSSNSSAHAATLMLVFAPQFSSLPSAAALLAHAQAVCLRVRMPASSLRTRGSRGVGGRRRDGGA